MTLVDKIHGSELVTDKGKVFKFDAVECMVNYLMDNSEMKTSLLLTNYYEEPTELISVFDATFLISENLPSPMRANLTAFKTAQKANEILLAKSGKLYTWEELKVHLKEQL